VRRSAPYLGLDTVAPLIDEWRMEIGHKYHSSAIVSAPDGDGALHEDPFQSRGRSGTRAPHLPVERAGMPCSTLDLFNRNFVLLAGAAGDAWCDATRAAGRRCGVTVDAYRVGPGGDVLDPTGAFTDTYGLSPAGAVLVRPDGFVAWRSPTMDANAGEIMPRALSAVLSRD
jgi:putative polyketide hydroxylase